MKPIYFRVISGFILNFFFFSIYDLVVKARGYERFVDILVLSAIISVFPLGINRQLYINAQLKLRFQSKDRFLQDLLSALEEIGFYPNTTVQNVIYFECKSIFETLHVKIQILENSALLSCPSAYLANIKGKMQPYFNLPI